MKIIGVYFEKSFTYLFRFLLTINLFGIVLFGLLSTAEINLNTFLQAPKDPFWVFIKDLFTDIAYYFSGSIVTFALALHVLLLLLFGIAVWRKLVQKKDGALLEKAIKTFAIWVLGFIVLFIQTSWQMQSYNNLIPAIEYHAAAGIYERKDIQTIIDKYPSTVAWVAPLNYALIEDEAYIDRLLPQYAGIDVHCIIIAHSPEETRYFLEQSDNTFVEIPSEEFLRALEEARPQDATLFWENIRPDVRTVIEHYRD